MSCLSSVNSKSKEALSSLYPFIFSIPKSKLSISPFATKPESVNFAYNAAFFSNIVNTPEKLKPGSNVIVPIEPPEGAQYTSKSFISNSGTSSQGTST